MENIVGVEELLKLNLEIPQYQRPYKWTNQNMEDLLNDISNAIADSGYDFSMGVDYVHKNNRKVDVLITEGTMMSRLTEKVMSEPEMQMEACKYLKQHKYAFLICSSTNLDSLASFYQAAQSASAPYGRYLYTYNSYLEK